MSQHIFHVTIACDLALGQRNLIYNCNTSTGYGAHLAGLDDVKSNGENGIRMAENGFAPPLGNFADISYLVEN